jgi:hypothetical protein
MYDIPCRKQLIRNDNAAIDEIKNSRNELLEKG